MDRVVGDERQRQARDGRRLDAAVNGAWQAVHGILAFGRELPLAHDGQEFVFVLEGSIELTYDGKRCVLQAGDSAYLDATRSHLFRGLGSTPSRMLAVVTAGT